MFSHETARALHQLYDALPTHLHVNLAASWAKRRLAVPDGLRVHFADVAVGEQA